jgi:hypothetical protein
MCKLCRVYNFAENKNPAYTIAYYYGIQTYFMAIMKILSKNIYIGKLSLKNSLLILRDYSLQ